MSVFAWLAHTRARDVHHPAEELGVSEPGDIPETTAAVENAEDMRRLGI